MINIEVFRILSHFRISGLLYTNVLIGTVWYSTKTYSRLSISVPNLHGTINQKVRPILLLMGVDVYTRFVETLNCFSQCNELRIKLFC